MTLLASYLLGDLCAQYWTDDAGTQIGLTLIPQGWEGKTQPKKQSVDPLVQLMIRGDDFPNGFANGHTLRASASPERFGYVSQQAQETEAQQTVTTLLRAEDGQQLTHTVTHRAGCQGVEITTVYRNGSDKPVTLDMLSSFCLGGLTPFIAGDAPESMVVHRLRSKWSNEARLESQRVEDLQLEPSWAGYGVASERFGQVGSMPVRRYFPFVAVEDVVNGVIWGAQLACPSSWQMEVYRRDDALCLSGGLADYDFGHWCKTFAPGEDFEAPAAYLTACAGDIDALCARLLSMHAVDLRKASMPSPLPVVFNEYCTTWGNPSQQSNARILQTLRGHDIDYYVIDAGWYADETMVWHANMGDWEVNPTLFPDGLAKSVQDIRDAGFKPGIWFELEVCGKAAKAYRHSEHQLSRFGVPITVGSRRFWDMRDPWVTDYLEQRVTQFLQHYGFEYLKVDYNDCIGVGCDGAESLGEGLRQNQLTAYSFLAHLRESVPGLVVENCSSGGHRLEPSYLGLCQLASFSDAHEVPEIPIVAANLHRAMLPRQSLVWAALRKDDLPKRLIWSLCAGMLGVLCLSGDVCDLSPAQWAITDDAIRFYRLVSPIIENGVTARHGPAIASYRHPKGWQLIERTAPETGEKLMVAHSFDAQPVEIRIALNAPYRICDRFAESDCRADISGDTLCVTLTNGACALYLCRV